MSTKHQPETWTAKEARAAMAGAPVVRLDELCPEGALAVVAPHPDDEALGCGGLIASAAAQGRKVLVTVLTDGAGSHPSSRSYPPERLAALRLAETRAACSMLAGANARVEGFEAKDGRLSDSESKATAWLADLFATRQVTCAFTTWDADPHPDHKAAARIARMAADHFGVPLWAYPIWGLVLDDGEPAGLRRPCRRLDIRPVLARKAQAIQCYRSQTTDLISDDPDGFRLRAGDVDRHLGSHEAFIQLAPTTVQTMRPRGGSPGRSPPELG